jgi:molybdopterin molybdotransferase
MASAASVDPARRGFLRVVLETNGTGSPVVRLAGSQGSHVLSGLAASNGLAVVPEGMGRVEAGTEVDVIRLDSGPIPAEADS